MLQNWLKLLWQLIFLDTKFEAIPFIGVWRNILDCSIHFIISTAFFQHYYNERPSYVYSSFVFKIYKMHAVFFVGSDDDKIII